jgi:uncharacterized protein YndB with AHSA1/START domain
VSEFRIVQDYPQTPAQVWRALTDPALIALWTTTGQGGRAVGFSTAVGTRFQYVARPLPGWNGVVQCEVLEAREAELLRYSWLGDDDDDVTEVVCRLVPHAAGTRFTWEHTGFSGISGWVMCKLLGSVRSKMLREGFPAVLAGLTD